VQGARVLERPSVAFVASPQKNMNFSTSNASIDAQSVSLNTLRAFTRPSAARRSGAL
jgi:hypothetical protein